MLKTPIPILKFLAYEKNFVYRLSLFYPNSENSENYKFYGTVTSVSHKYVHARLLSNILILNHDDI